MGLVADLYGRVTYYGVGGLFIFPGGYLEVTDIHTELELAQEHIHTIDLSAEHIHTITVSTARDS